MSKSLPQRIKRGWFRNGNVRVWGHERIEPDHGPFCKAHGRQDCYPCHRKPAGKP
jgi:hypothetical protein